MGFTGDSGRLGQEEFEGERMKLDQKRLQEIRRMVREKEKFRSKPPLQTKLRKDC